MTEAEEDLVGCAGATAVIGVIVTMTTSIALLIMAIFG
jgi:hypothetical protein